MKLLKFKDNEHYEKTQLKTIIRRSIRPGFLPSEIKTCSDYLKTHGTDGNIKGICHGARNGLESDEFLKYFPEATIIGTDLNPYQGKGAYYKSKTEVVKYNFSNPNPVWTGAMDFVYSNSLDHSQCPVETISVWLQQLKPDGWLFIKWVLREGGVRWGDCFACSSDELIEIVNRKGKVVECIPLMIARRNTYVILTCKGKVDTTNPAGSIP